VHVLFSLPLGAVRSTLRSPIVLLVIVVVNVREKMF